MHIRISRLTIGQKLAGGFVALIIGLLAVAGVAMSGMNSMISVHRAVVRVDEAKALAAERARSAASDMHFSETLYALAGPSQRDNYLADRQTFQGSLNHLAGLMTSGSDRTYLTAIDTGLAGFDQGDAHLWALVRAGQRTAAQQLAQNAQNDASDALASALRAAETHATAEVAARTGQFDATASSAQWTMIGIGALALLVAIGAGVVLTRSLSRRAQALLTIADAVSDGDVDQHIEVTSQDELGATAAAFERMIAYLTEMAGVAERIADGNLAVQVTPRSDRDALGRSFSRMVLNLRALVGEVSTAAGQVDSASGQMTSTSQQAGRATGEIAQAVSEVAHGAERQVELIDSARRAADDVAGAVRQSAEEAAQTVEVAARAREAARQGVQASEEASVAMDAVRSSSEGVTSTIRDLAGKSQQIEAIVSTIGGIAEQTNLLALNAAIEAARAGEQGKGFAVVAEQVRKLAEESKAAAREIADLVTAIQSETGRAVDAVEDGARRTSDGAAVVDRAREAFEVIGQAVEDMVARVQAIAEATNTIDASASDMQHSIAEVASVAEESSATAEQVSANTEHTSATTQQIAASAGELSTSATVLNELVARFRLDMS